MNSKDTPFTILKLKLYILKISFLFARNMIKNYWVFDSITERFKRTTGP